jgi:AcrR family transcriptional regulator
MGAGERCRDGVEDDMDSAAEHAPVRSGRPKRGRGPIDRRREILDAARALFVSEGYEATSIRKIAARVGVSSTALYLYFADKDEIFGVLCDEAFSKLVAAFQAVEEANLTPLEAAGAQMRAYVDFGMKYPDEYRLIFMTPAKGDRPYASHRDVPSEADGPGFQGALAFQGLLRVVQRLMDAGVIARRDPYLVGEMMWASSHGLVSLMIVHPGKHWSDLDTLVAGMMDALMCGLLVDRSACG